MIILDTNAFYWYVGRDKLGIPSTAPVDVNKLCFCLDNRYDKGLAVSSLVEALVHFQQEPEKIEHIMHFIQDKQLMPYNNFQYYGLDARGYSWLLNMKIKDLIENIHTIITPIKIAIEARFSAVFYVIMLILYLRYRIDLYYKNYVGYEYYIGEFILKDVLNDTLDSFFLTLRNAYSNRRRHEEQVLKTEYISKLEIGCKTCDATLDLLSAYEDTSDVDYNAITQRVNSEYASLKNSYSQNYLMKRIDSTLQTDAVFLNLAKSRVAEMFSERGKMFAGMEKMAYKKLQLSYLEEVLFDAWMKKEQKLRKNDIFDFFFLGCDSCNNIMDDKNSLAIDSSTYLLSFDDQIVNFLDEKNASNGRIIRSFYIFQNKK